MDGAHLEKDGGAFRMTQNQSPYFQNRRLFFSQPTLPKSEPFSSLNTFSDQLLSLFLIFNLL